jgi:hypothetical protein
MVAGGRGGIGQLGHGSGEYANSRDHPERCFGANQHGTDHDLEDAISGPVKKGDTHMSDVDKLAKKRLALETGANIFSENLGLSPMGNKIVDPMTVDGDLLSGNAGKEPEDGKEKKRHKKIDDNTVSYTNLGSAALLEGDRRSQ